MKHALEWWVWWLTIHLTISSFVASFSTCQHIKNSTQRTPGLLQPFLIPFCHFESCSLDLITKLPLSHGYNAVLPVWIAPPSWVGSPFVS